jgi:galactokinase
MTRSARLDADDLRDLLMAAYSSARESPDEVRVVRAPGRVNLIGEHTDYNEGLVLPVAIDLETWICSVPSDDRSVELTRSDTGEREAFDVDDPGSRRGRWIDYPAGVAAALASRGVGLRGVRGVIASTLPISAGLSSSAALELASAWTLAVTPPPLSPMELARAAQEAENRYVGVNSGIMDQFASAFGRDDAALLLDCRSLASRPVPLPLERVRLVVCYSDAPRELAGSAYNERRAECERAVEVLRENGHDVDSLRDVTLPMLEPLRDGPDARPARRAEHVIQENQRVLDTEAALAAGDLVAVGRSFAESHASLRDLYEVSSPELDALVEIAASTEGVVAARMTGAGFGGCTVNLVEPGAESRLMDAVATRYTAMTGRVGQVWPVRPARGASIVAS